MSDPEPAAAVEENPEQQATDTGPPTSTGTAESAGGESETVTTDQAPADVVPATAASADQVEAAAETGAPSAAAPAPVRLSEPLPAGQLGRLAESDESCFVCGYRWQSSLRYRLARDVYMFALPRQPPARRDWLLSLHWSRASAPPADGRLCSLHFGPSDIRPVPGQRQMAQLLPIAMPRRWADRVRRGERWRTVGARGIR